MKCDKCGNILPDNARFCTVCGNAFIDVEAEATTVLKGGDDMMSGGYSTGLVPMSSVRRKEEVVIDYEFPGGEYSSTNVQQRRDDYWMYDRPTTRDYVNPTPGGGYVGQVQYGNGYGVPVNYDNEFGGPDRQRAGGQGYSQGAQGQAGGARGHSQGSQIFPKDIQQDDPLRGRRPAQDISQKLASQKPQQSSSVPPYKPQSNAQKKNGKNKALPFIIIGIVAAVIIAAVAVGILLFKDKIKDYMAKANTTVVYVADGEYKHIINAKKGVTAEFDEVGSDDFETMFYAADGKYLYYYTKYDENNGYGVLNRVQVKKLGKNPEKNEELSLEIASKVSNIYGVMKDGSVFYVKEGTTYYFDGRTSKKLDKNVDSLYISDKGDYIAYLIDEGDSDKKKLYYAEIKDFNNRILLADDVDTFALTKNGRIYYAKIIVDDSTYDYYYELYSTDKNKNSKLISDDVYGYIFDMNDGQIFYSIENGKRINPGDEYDDSCYLDLYLFDGKDSRLITSDNLKVKMSYGLDGHVSATSISDGGKNQINYSGDSKNYELSAEVADIAASDVRLYNTKTGPAYYDDDSESLYMCRISGDKVELADKIDQVKDVSIGNGEMYYLQYDHADGDNNICSMYLYKGGYSEILGGNITEGNTALLYPDGTVIEYGDDDKINISNPGKVFEYSVEDYKGDVIYNGLSDFYYISDRDLYHYNGKTDKLIDTYVEYVISSYEMTPVVIF